MLWIIKNAGFVLIGLAVLIALALVIGAKARAVQEDRKQAEKDRAAERAARERAEKAAREKAEKDNAARIAAAEKEKAKAARAAELARIQAEKQAAREKRRAEQDARAAEKLENARKLAEYRERALAAARELRALDENRPADPAPKRPETISAGKASADPDPVRPSAPAPDPGPKPFAGQVVSFTGTLKSMRRAQAIEMVKAAGGRAFETMPAGTTLLVIGDTKGRNTNKMDLAGEWIGQVKRITEEQFIAMFNPA